MPAAKKLTWTADEDVVLKRVLSEAGVQRLSNGAIVLNGSWGDVATHLPGRSAKQCRERWRFNLCPDINKSEWSCEEDATLIESQLKIGNQWALIARQLDGRTENSVKIRFKSILRASRRVWTAKDDADLLALHKLMGSKWGVIAERMPNRTRNGVKTRFLMLRNGVTERPLQSGAAEQLFRADRYELLVERFIQSAGVRALPAPASPEHQPQSAVANPQQAAMPLPDIFALETRHSSFASDEFAEDERHGIGAAGLADLSRSSSKRSASWLEHEAPTTTKMSSSAATTDRIGKTSSPLSSPGLGPLPLSGTGSQQASAKRMRGSYYPEGADESLLEIIAPHADRDWRGGQRHPQASQQQHQEYSSNAPQQHQHQPQHYHHAEQHYQRRAQYEQQQHQSQQQQQDGPSSFLQTTAPVAAASSSSSSVAPPPPLLAQQRPNYEGSSKHAQASSSGSPSTPGFSPSTLQLALALANSEALSAFVQGHRNQQQQQQQQQQHGDEQRMRSLLKLY